MREDAVCDRLWRKTDLRGVVIDGVGFWFPSMIIWFELKPKQLHWKKTMHKTFIQENKALQEPQNTDLLWLDFDTESCYTYNFDVYSPPKSNFVLLFIAISIHKLGRSVQKPISNVFDQWKSEIEHISLACVTRK